MDTDLADSVDATSARSGSSHRISPEDVPEEGRVRSVTVDGRSIAMTRCAGRLGALENDCPRQGGPLGEGSIEEGLLRCPWHGYDYDPVTGAPHPARRPGMAGQGISSRERTQHVRPHPTRA